MHRDIKCANILLSKKREIKLTDLGCAKDMESFKKSVIGTASYIAPEVLLREKYERFVDIWSLGCMVFELLTGERPFKGKSIFVVARKIIDFDDNYEFLEEHELSPMAVDFVKCCIKRDQRGRYNSKYLLKHPFVIHSQANMLKKTLSFTKEDKKIDFSEVKINSDMKKDAFRKKVKFEKENFLSMVK